MHLFAVDDVLPSARHEPRLHAEHAARPVDAAAKPTGHTVPIVIITALDTLDADEALRAYVPAPPVAPVSCATMYVPAVMPVKRSALPAARAAVGVPVT